MLWTEKYRPKRIADVVGQYNFTIDAESWVEQGNMPNLLLYGIAGVGKTAAGIAVANDILKEDKDNNFFVKLTITVDFPLIPDFERRKRQKP